MRRVSFLEEAEKPASILIYSRMISNDTNSQNIAYMGIEIAYNQYTETQLTEFEDFILQNCIQDVVPRTMAVITSLKTDDE